MKTVILKYIHLTYLLVKLSCRHVDTNHKLNGWGFVFHGCIDGYSRCITYLKCCTNNRASTALELFQEATRQFGLPNRVRGDAGSENIDIARFMIENRGLNRGSFLVGPSVHNQRIERLWAEVNRVASAYFKDIFLFMENSGILDSNNHLHIIALQHIFLPRINRSLKEFVLQWNNHSLRTAEGMSPLQLWATGMQQDLLNVNAVQRAGLDANTVSDSDLPINPFVDDGNHGIELFLNTCNILETYQP